jgi:hypothetical protein
MSEHDRNLAAMDQGDTERHRVAQSLIQEAIDEVAEDAQGRDVQDVRARLVEALEGRGIGEQPPRWLDSVSAELAGGRRYVEDPRQA